jgi:pimeloyl-ACP methyl ester carboxylesterase
MRLIPLGRQLARRLPLMGALALLSGLAGANVIETTLQVPVRVSGPDGRLISRTIAVRAAWESAAKALPYLVLLHGRPAEPAQRARLALPIYPANTRYFAEHGFAVLTPLRIGYGASGGPDAEDTGDCASKHYPQGIAAGLAQVRQLLDYARALPSVDPAHGIIVGESFGGLLAIAAAADRLPGLAGVINISGGDGGDSLNHPDAPCRPDQLRDTLAFYGRSVRIPTLWLYSANDRLWGSEYPRQWFAAFTAAGGTGTFMQLPADKNNGHFIFNRNVQAWHPAFEQFLAVLKDAGGGLIRGSRASPRAP